MATPRRASLHQAVLKRDLTAIDEELDVPWERIKRRRVNVSKDGFSALHVALSETMGAVLEGANSGKPNIEALSKTHFPILKRLVEAGADVNLNFPCANSRDKANTAFGVFCKTMVVALDAFTQAEKAEKKKAEAIAASRAGSSSTVRSSTASSSGSDSGTESIAESSNAGSSSERDMQQGNKQEKPENEQSDAHKAFHKILDIFLEHGADINDELFQIAAGTNQDSVVKRLLERKYTEDIPEETLPEQFHDKACSVCLEDFKCNESVTTLKCGHSFHPHCILPVAIESRARCPVCRSQLF